MSKDDCKICKYLTTTETDRFFITRLSSSIVRLKKDQYNRGYITVYFHDHKENITELSDEENLGLYQDMLKMAKAVKEIFSPDHMNYLLMGNKVPHLHWHIIPRYKWEVNWGTAIWVEPQPEVELKDEEYAEIINEIRMHLSKQTSQIQAGVL
ncbi:MAG: HIT family protein [Candidatus Eremiobacteraeota bacterium]|nr:HIT family protein [Candidatus Eremiobacteraeota bacterium]